jgi:hypothetical protein
VEVKIWRTPPTKIGIGQVGHFADELHQRALKILSVTARSHRPEGWSGLDEAWAS